MRHYIWAIHTALYRMCCIEYTWLFVNAQFYAVFCVFRIPNVYFLAFNQFDISLAFKQFDSTKPIQLLKNMWAIHTTLYRVCCIAYTGLFVNAQSMLMYCVFGFLNVFFWHLKNLILKNI